MASANCQARSTSAWLQPGALEDCCTARYQIWWEIRLQEGGLCLNLFVRPLSESGCHRGGLLTVNALNAMEAHQSRVPRVELPREIIQMIFSHLNFKSLFDCQFVCKTWNTVLRQCESTTPVWDPLSIDHYRLCCKQSDSYFARTAQSVDAIYSPLCRCVAG